jgi:hypothetical protein
MSPRSDVAGNENAWKRVQRLITWVMVPTKEELKLGMEAYQRVRLFERYGKRHMRQTPWVLAGCALFMIFLAFLLKTHFDHGEYFIFFIFLAAAFLWNWAQGRLAKDTYAMQKMVLRLLEEKYGDNLPWLVEEKQMALAQRLQQEISFRQSSG